MAENKVTLNVQIQNFDKIKDLSKVLSKQLEQVAKTLDDMNHTELKIEL